VAERGSLVSLPQRREGPPLSGLDREQRQGGALRFISFCSFGGGGFSLVLGAKNLNGRVAARNEGDAVSGVCWPGLRGSVVG